ncbi:hypothetical protein ACSVH5_02350 [Flavobacterium sp. RSSA_27]|uniref:hypothetical protein n=1 Tax=Flavobacterium sp. RSSA_27 TaxID=3447667 RepID=UPI003F3791E2
MNSNTCPTFTAQATFGLNRGYTNSIISLTEFKAALTKTQQAIHSAYSIAISAKITPCEIVFLGQEEPSVTIEIIQYPKFQYEVQTLKTAFIALTEKMMLELEQNRVVIVFPDTTVMLEQNEAIDPKIRME